MNKLLLATFAAGVVLAGTAADAFARDRSVTATGRGGHTVSRDFHSGCANGSCARERSTTGPAGRTRSHGSSVSNNGDGTYTAERHGEGRRGGSYERSVTGDGDGSYTYSGTATGPGGKTVTKEKTVTR